MYRTIVYQEQIIYIFNEDSHVFFLLVVYVWPPSFKKLGFDLYQDLAHTVDFDNVVMIQFTYCAHWAIIFMLYNLYGIRSYINRCFCASGTTGWVGADGYLRLQDYIADNEGYRIYKSKTVFVGQNRPIGVCVCRFLIDLT